MHAGEEPYAKQKRWKLFDVSEGNIAPLVLLATLNGTLVAVLLQYISDPVAMQLLRQSAGPGFTSLVATVAPALFVYASLYVLGPAFRYLRNLMRNSQVEQGNELRGRAAQVRVNVSLLQFCTAFLLSCHAIVHHIPAELWNPVLALLGILSSVSRFCWSSTRKGGMANNPYKDNVLKTSRRP